MSRKVIGLMRRANDYDVQAENHLRNGMYSSAASDRLAARNLRRQADEQDFWERDCERKGIKLSDDD